MTALPLIVFDVNETLLDLQTMEPTFQRIFGEKRAMRLWFANLIMYSAALTVAGCYVSFTDIGSAVMKMLADTQGIKINDADKEELKEKFSTMPPHRDVPAALRRLRDAGFRLFTLTDNLFEVQTLQLEHGGIVDLFERRFSADGVKHHKPSPQAYAYVEKELGVQPSQLCLIACHTWDTLGAVAAGWQGALIKRAGNDVLGVGPQPHIVGNDLNDVADQLIARHKGRGYHVRFGPLLAAAQPNQGRALYPRKPPWHSLTGVSGRSLDSLAETQEWLGDRLHGLAALQQLRSLHRRYWLAEQIALHFGAAFFLECLELLFGLDTFGSRLHAKADAHGCDGTDDCNRLGALGKIFHERTVDLDLVERKFLQIG